MLEVRICYLAQEQNQHLVFNVGEEQSRLQLLLLLSKEAGALREVTAEQLVEFANCRGDIDAVVRYIARFGYPGDVASGTYLQDLLKLWDVLQSQFRGFWERLLTPPNGVEDTTDRDRSKISSRLQSAYSIPIQGSLKSNEDGFLYLAETQFMALNCELLVIAGTGKLRKCLNPDCASTPYFIPAHGKTQYCSDQCGHIGQKKAKRKYWNEKKQLDQLPPQAHQGNGKKKVKRNSQLKRGEDGAHQTR